MINSHVVHDMWSAFKAFQLEGAGSDQAHWLIQGVSLWILHFAVAQLSSLPCCHLARELCAQKAQPIGSMENKSSGPHRPIHKSDQSST